MDVIDELISEHSHVRSILAFFKRELDRFERAEEVEYEILHGTISYCHDYLDQWHHTREDILFETMSRRDPARSEPLSEISGQHSHLARSTSELAGVFRDVCERGALYLREELVTRGGALAAAYEQHLDWEETHFFPAARAVLTADDWQELAIRTAGPANPLASHPVEEHYRMLFSILHER